MAAKRKKQLRKLWLWTRIWQVRFKRWWFRNDSRYGVWWRLGNGAAAVLILVAAVIPVLQQLSNNAAYKLSADALKLVGSTDPTLAKQLTYDASTATYQFNKSAIKDDSANPAAALQAQVGTANGAGKNKSLYALDVPQSISKGVTYHDINSGLSFSLVPQFSGSQGQEVNGHLVFPLGGGTQAIYTLKNNGLKEDIVVQKPTEDTMTFSYKLDLPNTLEAKVIPNSGGAIGIYSADPTLFGNITFGSDADRATVQKARENGDKTYLVFGLPSPVIKSTDGSSVGSARFQLDGDQLSVIASGLAGVTMPITIDPSVVVSSASDFQAGNVEDNIDLTTSGQITRGAVTGGTISAGWTSPGSSFTTARYGNAAVAANGYLYVIAGCGQQSTVVACSSGHYLSDIQYIALNATTGALTGSWASAGSSLGTGRFGLSAVAYNGYLYAIGGYDGTTYNSDVQSIAINPSTGALTGGWNPSAGSFSGGRYFGAAVVYSGDLYVLGGYDGSSTYYSTTLYASLNADGSVGTFTSASNSFATGRFGLSAMVYNNFMYVLGGCSAGTCSTYKNDVQYAAINTDGSLGAWHYTHNSLDDSTSFVAGFTTTRFGQSAIVSNGYMYVAGGYSGSYKTDSQYAQINANGTIGTWATANTTNNFSALAEGSSLVYNGYLYTVGGTVSGTPNAGTLYAKADSAGATAGWAPTTSLPTNGGPAPGATSAAGCIAYNGYIYIIGGANGATNTYITTVEYAPLNASGTIGTWAPAQSLLKAVGTEGVAVYNGYMYAVGGFTTGASAVNDIQYASIGSNGVLGTWADTTTTLPSAIANQTAMAYNGYLYEIGSSGTAASNVVKYVPIASNGNITGSWTQTNTGGVPNNLSTAVQLEGFTAYGGYAYVLGGVNGSSATIKTIQYGPISSNGNITSWTPTPAGTTSMGTERDKFMAYAANGYLYAVGGENNSNVAQLTTEYAPINSDGSVGNWTNGASLPLSVMNAGGATYNGYVYTVSGNVGGSRSLIAYYGSINNGGSGSNGTWTDASTSLSTPYSSGWAYGGTFAANGYLYTVGGYDNSSALSGTYSAPLSMNGSVGSWTALTGKSLNVARYKFGLAVYNGYVYACAGQGASSDLNTCEYAQIGTGGTLGAWTNVTMNLSAGSVGARSLVSTAVYNGYLYVLGGTHSGTPNSDVYYAPLNSDGSIGTWAATTSFTTARNSQQSFAYAGYLYVLGGLSGSTYFSDVQVAPIQSNGTITASTWVATTTLLRPRALMQVSVANGFVYIFAGTSTSSAPSLLNTEFAPINANGSLGTWQQTIGGLFTVAANGPGATMYNGYLYMVGGDSGTGGTPFIKDVQYAPLSVQPRVGHYSKLVDLTSAVNVTSVTYTGAAATVSYRSAGTNALFGSSALASSVSGAGGCAGNLAGVRYVWVSVTLDDSTGLKTGGFFPDLDGVFNATTGTPNLNAQLDDFTVSYNATHPTPLMRLRGGKTLQSGALIPLDTCGS